jgi:hypothetical protein
MSAIRTDPINPPPRDILGNWRQTVLAYGLPIVAIMATGNPAIGNGWRTALWTAACLVMGGACLLNALRCGRIHCYFTAPFFLAIAGLAVLFGAGVVPLGPNGWNRIGLTLRLGGVLLTFGPEPIFGKYRARKTSSRR